MRFVKKLAIGIAGFALSLPVMSAAAHPGEQRGMHAARMGHGMMAADADRSAGPGGCDALGRGAAAPAASVPPGHMQHAHGAAQGQREHGAGHEHHGGTVHGMGPMGSRMGAEVPAR